MTTALITGGTGFAGHHLVEHLLHHTDWNIHIIDGLTYAGRFDRLTNINGYNPDRVKITWHDLRAPIPDHIPHPTHILHLAAESHVDRSITNPHQVIHNNVMATTNLLEWSRTNRHLYHFIQISTDEVYGAAQPNERHTEWSPIVPSNPYSASKAAQEAIAIAYWRTFGTPLTITNTMNLFGERQHPEKFIPKTIKAILNDQPVELHGKFGNWSTRHWLHARNHADALLWLIHHKPPTVYSSHRETPRPNRWNVAGEEQDVHQIAQFIAAQLNRNLISKPVDYHQTRPGHDHRYALDDTKLRLAGWTPPLSLLESLNQTINWTLNNQGWLQ